MRAKRQWAVRGAIAAVLVASLIWSAAPVSSRSGGVDMSEAGTGCTCHTALQNGHATIQFAIAPLSSDQPLTNLYYEAGKTYTIRMSFDDVDVPMNASPTANKGGFLVHASGGKFLLNANSSRIISNVSVALVQLKDSDTSITHTAQGDVVANRAFSFDWVAPAANNTDVVFDIFVNAVNGDASFSSADRWTHAASVLPGQPGAGGEVDISKLGVPLRAYWLGIIGILSTIFLLVLSFYVIRSGSKFYEFGLPRGQVKSVKIRTIPAPKTKGSYAVMTGLIVILIVIVVVFFSIRDEALTATQATGFLMAVAIVMALAAAYYIRAFLPLVDVLEEESIEPLK